MSNVTQPPMIIKPDSITAVLPGVGPVTVTQGQFNWGMVCRALKEKNWEELVKALQLKEIVVCSTGGKVEVRGGQILVNGIAANNYLTNKILRFIENGIDVSNLLAFLENLVSNPSFRAREELYKFLETEDLPITADGHFLAYKAVTSDFMDKHSRTVRNRIGDVVSMPRPQVDDNQQAGCSHGLHAGSIAYVKGFACYLDNILIVKINPADVVCIPNEDCRKLRCCRYEVLQLMDRELASGLYANDGSVELRNQAWDDDESEDDFDVDVYLQEEEEDDDEELEELDWTDEDTEEFPNDEPLF